MSSHFDDAKTLSIVAVGLILLAIVLSIAQIPIQIAAWVTGLPIPDSIKLVLLEHIFAFTIALFGIPTIIIGKLAKWF